MCGQGGGGNIGSCALLGRVGSHATDFGAGDADGLRRGPDDRGLLCAAAKIVGVLWAQVLGPVRTYSCAYIHDMASHVPVRTWVERARYDEHTLTLRETGRGRGRLGGREREYLYTYIFICIHT